MSGAVSENGIDLTSKERDDCTNSESSSTSGRSHPPSYNQVIAEKEEAKTQPEDDDPWAVTDLVDRSVAWDELTTGGKVKRVLWNYTFRQILLLGLLYMFICSLDFLSSAFRLLGGKTAGQVFSDNEIFNNPVAGLVIGVLATVLVQSSSTSTSIVVSMVGSGLLKVKIAIPIIMGANIGTSVTNTIVSLSQSGDRNQFRRAFGGATVHDMFNWLSVIVLLPLELATGYLFSLSELIVNSFNIRTYEDGNVKLLKAITAPFTQYVIKVDTKIITLIALNKTSPSTSLIKMKCKDSDGSKYNCPFMFMNVAGQWADWVIGLILLFIALFVLCTCLVLIVKILNNIFKGHIAVILKKFVNADFPGKCGKYGTGYLAILIGALLTILVQSSSIFTSALTPLVGLGVITLDRMYPLTLGSNIGTTFTAILASLAQDGDTLSDAMQVSMCHLFFNISGILLWYPIPFMRRAPIFLAKKLGNITAKYRWFAAVYLIIVFFLLPAGIFGLSVAGWEALVGVGVPLLVLVVIIVIINILQGKRPQCLPGILRSWEFLPLCLHSFKPIDRIISKVFRRCSCCNNCFKQNSDEEAGTGLANTAADNSCTTKL